MLERDVPATSIGIDGTTERWYRLADGGPVEVRAEGPAGSTVTLFAADGRLPSAGHHDRGGRTTGSVATLRMQSSAGTYVMVRVTGAADGQATIRATVPPPTIDEVSPAVAIVGPLPMVISGELLGDATGVALVRDGVVVDADRFEVDPATGDLSAFFDTAAHSPGSWDVRVVSPTATVVEPGAIELHPMPDLLAGSAGVLDVSVSAPSAMRRAGDAVVIHDVHDDAGLDDDDDHDRAGVDDHDDEAGVDHRDDLEALAHVDDHDHDPV